MVAASFNNECLWLVCKTFMVGLRTAKTMKVFSLNVLLHIKVSASKG